MTEPILSCLALPGKWCEAAELNLPNWEEAPFAMPAEGFGSVASQAVPNSSWSALWLLEAIWKKPWQGIPHLEGGPFLQHCHPPNKVSHGQQGGRHDGEGEDERERKSGEKGK